MIHFRNWLNFRKENLMKTRENVRLILSMISGFFSPFCILFTGDLAVCWFWLIGNKSERKSEQKTINNAVYCDI